MRRSLSRLDFARTHSYAGREPAAPPVDRLADLKAKNAAQFAWTVADRVARGVPEKFAILEAERLVVGPRA